MAPLGHRSFAVAVLAAMSFAAFGAQKQSKRPTALEIAQLPKFCWAGFQVPNATGKEFQIVDCGVGMNHYCGGLLRLLRAKAAVGDRRVMMEHLGSAASAIRYTERAMELWGKNYPRCSIIEHVAASKAEVMSLQKVYGGQPSGAK